MRIKPNKKQEYLPWLFWFVHTFIFYMVYTFHPDISRDVYNVWGSILRLHGYLTIGYHLVYKLVQHYDRR